MNAFAAKPTLRSASRLPALADGSQLNIAEIACLLACGVAAAVAVGFVRFRGIGIPGHAILCGVLPMAMGLALVPRRSAGILMSIAAATTGAALNWRGIGNFQPTAMLGVVALGPVLDVALAGRPQGWRLYARLTLAGALANLLAYTLRFGLAYFGWQAGGGGGGGGGRQFMTFAWAALISFIICGAIAGLLSAIIWFRLRSSEPTT